MPITLNGTTGITDADGGTVLSTADFASQAEAEAGTDNTKLMTPLRTDQTILAQFNVSGSAPTYACRAWVNFNGTGTVAIRGSGNVSSITDNNIGDYTVNFTTAMPDVNYAVIGSADYSGTASTPVFNYNIVSSSSVRTQTKNGPTGNAVDNPSVSVSIFR
jgi:hypothetical protein